MTKYLLPLLLLAACSRDPGSETTAIAHFHKVTDGIYRGGQPDRAGMEYLQEHGIKTIVDLNDVIDTEIREGQMASELGIELFVFPMSGIFPDPGDYHPAASALKIIANAKYAPVYIHCEYGLDRTGLVIALYRTWFSGYSKDAAYSEWVKLGHNRMLFLFDYMYWKLTWGWV
jgi:protein tyrosine/serine phosphatase